MSSLNQQQFPLPGYEEQKGTTVSQFMRRATWHGTHQENWSEKIRAANVPIHSGTPQAAAERRLTSGRSDDPDPKMYPVMPKEISGTTIPDAEANTLENRYNYLQHPGAQPDRAPGEESELIRSAYKEMKSGKSVPYTNVAEDRGSTSYVSPPGGFTTLDQTTNFDELPRQQAFVEGRDLAQQGVVANRSVTKPLFSRNPHQNRLNPNYWYSHEGKPV